MKKMIKFNFYDKSHQILNILIKNQLTLKRNGVDTVITACYEEDCGPDRGGKFL